MDNNKPLRSKIIIEFQPKPGGKEGEFEMKVETHVQYRDMPHLPIVFKEALRGIVNDLIKESKENALCESKPDLN